jgi:hypothetical protein
VQRYAGQESEELCQEITTMKNKWKQCMKQCKPFLKPCSVWKHISSTVSDFPMSITRNLFKLNNFTCNLKQNTFDIFSWDAVDQG